MSKGKLLKALAEGVIASVVAVTGTAIAHTEKPAENNNNYCVVHADICPKVRNAVNWACAVADNNNIGYSFGNARDGEYDCSGLVLAGYRNAGIDVGGATYTGNMLRELTNHGFVAYEYHDNADELMVGDILLLEESHTEMYIGGGQNVGAHSDFDGVRGDSSGDEIDYGAFNEYTHHWEYILRYEPKWSDYCNTPELSDNFYAFIENGGSVLSSDGGAIHLEAENGTEQQVWHFVKESTGRYTVSNESISGSYNLYQDETGSIIFNAIGSDTACLTAVADVIQTSDYDSCSDAQRFTIRPVSDPIMVEYDFGGSSCPIIEEHYGEPYRGAFDLVITGFSGWYTEKEGGNKIDTSKVVNPYTHTLYAHFDAIPEENTSAHSEGGGRHDCDNKEESQPETEAKTEALAIADDIDVQRDDIFHSVQVTEPPVQVTPATEPVTERTPVISDSANQNEYNTRYSNSSNEIETPQHNESSTNINWIPGYNIGWKLEGNVFTITGNGEMPYYYDPSDAPWSSVGPNVRKVVIDEGVTTVGGQAFTSFKNMSEVSLPSTIRVIGRYAFQTTPIQYISLPNGLERIEQGAFYSCKKLTSITIPNSVYDIDTFVFAECSSLSDVTLSTSITSIGDGTFEECTSLRSLVIPSGVQSIGGYSFLACNLDYLSIPQSLQTVGYGGFYDSVIHDVYYGGSEIEWGSIDVHNVRNQALSNASIHYNSVN